MNQTAQQILSQISQIAGQLAQQESLNAKKLQGQELGVQEQQQMAMLEQTAAQKLAQIQQMIQQYQQLNQSQQGFQTGATNGQVTDGQSIFQPGFAGTDVEEVRQLNQQSQQNMNGGNTFS